MKLIEQVNCPICQSRNKRLLLEPTGDAFSRFLDLSNQKYSGSMNDWVTQISLRIYCCNSCTHIWHAEFPDLTSLIKMYASSKAIDVSKRLNRPSARMLKEMSLLRSLVCKLERPRLLDFGSGFGLWAAAARQVGFEVIAYEPSFDRSSSITADPEVRSVNDLESLKGETFDVINIEQVLEHVSDPVAVVRSLKQFCHKNSIFRITVPNSRRYVNRHELMKDFPYDGRAVHHLSPFEHLHGFTPKSLRFLLIACGLKKDHSLLQRDPVQWLRMMIPNTFVIASTK